MDDSDLEDLEEEYLRKTQRHDENDEKMRVSGKGVFVIRDQLKKKAEKSRKFKREE